MNDYSVVFTVDGSMVINAESADAAEREAIDILEGLDIMDAVDSDIDSCVVRVSLRFDDDEVVDPKCEKLDRAAKAVEFA